MLPLRRWIGIVVVVAVLAGFGVFWAITIPATVAVGSIGPRTPNLDNGKTMFLIGGCSSCHATLNQDDPTRLGGGYALKSPFGVFHAPNISPDPEHGIGQWSETDFASAMLKGTARDGSHLYPAFPYTSYQHMRLDDVRDLYAYLRTLPAVPDASKPHELPFPFSIRRTVGVWKFLFLDGKEFRPDARKDAAWNRGAYLVNGPGHCAECHSPRNALGGIIESQRFAGGPDATDPEGFVPNITQKELGSWSKEQFIRLFSSGELPDGDTVSGDMAKVAAATAKLSDADRDAIATYVKSLPPVEGPKPPERK